LEDSDNKIPEQPVPVKKPAVTEELIVRSDGRTIPQVRSHKNGRFVKRTTPESEAREITKNFMMAYDKGVTGRASKRRVEQHLEQMHQLLMENYRQPLYNRLGRPVYDEKGEPVLVVDAKIMAVQVQAFTALQDRFVGKPSKSAEDRDAQKYTGIQTVLVMPNIENLPNKEIQPERAESQLRPSPEFIEAEIKEDQREK